MIETIIKSLKNCQKSWVRALDMISLQKIAEFAEALQIEKIDDSTNRLYKICAPNSKLSFKRYLPPKFENWSQDFKKMFVVSNLFTIASIEQDWKSHFLVSLDGKRFFYPKNFGLELSENRLLVETSFAKYLQENKLNEFFRGRTSFG